MKMTYLLAGLTAWACAQGAHVPHTRPFTLRDSIELSTFINADPMAQVSSPVSYAPDRAHFLVVTLRGNLETGNRDATLWIFDSTAIARFSAQHLRVPPPEPRALVRLGSAANTQPLSAWRWSEDSRSVLFLQADHDGARTLYRARVADGELEKLSLPDQDVDRFDERLGKVVYLAHRAIRAEQLYQAGGASLPEIEIGTGRNVLPLLFPHWMDVVFRESANELWVSGTGGVPRRVGDVTLKGSHVGLSPDGQRVLVTRFARHIPKAWERYRSLMDYPGFDIVADPDEAAAPEGYLRPRQYALITLASAQETPLMDAPIDVLTADAGAKSTWSHDGSRLALVGAYPLLPSDPGSAQPPRDVYPCAIAVMALDTRQASCVLPEPYNDYKHIKYGDREQLLSLSWSADDGQLIAEFSTPNAPRARHRRTFSRNGAHWQTRSSQDAPVVAGYTIEVREGLDEPPRLVVQGRGTLLRTLLDPNPALAQIALGSAEAYHWQDSNGDAWSGALVKPAGFDSARRYPLVIQTHDLDWSRFLVDGPSATGFAARAFAARDMLVLQVDEIRKDEGTPKESETGARGYRGAIAQLVREGHVDPSKVGITTWSHMGPYAMAGLIDEPTQYAAATFAEAAFDSYGEYLMNIDYMGREREQMFRAQYGAKPFGAGLEAWMKNGAAFRTDRVCTPILFQINSPPALVYTWDSYAALRAQEKPVDMLYLRSGDHVLVQPRQRMAEQGMNIDWFDYWLNGRRDSDPNKANQYKRWDALRSLRCQ